MKKTVVLLISLACATAAVAQDADWQKNWDATVTAAKAEGRVVIVGSPDPVMRNEIIPKFAARFGFPIEFLAGSSGQTTGRVQTERASGIYSVDLYLSGVGTSVTVLYKDKMIDPMKPMLVLPEVTDPSKWKTGKIPFKDPEGEYVLQLFSNIDATVFINTDYVKPEELRSVKDLLNPKFKGKITTQDPNATGAGSNYSVHLFSQLGADFIKKLYIDQKPVISNDRRQFTDWLARGVTPICLTCRDDDVRPLKADGFKLAQVLDLQGIKERRIAAPFLMTVANKAPHPNAAKVFVNWLASREAMEIYSRGYNAATLRTDLDESFLDRHIIPKPGVEYADDTDFDWILAGRPAAAKKVKDLLKSQ